MALGPTQFLFTSIVGFSFAGNNVTGTWNWPHTGLWRWGLRMRIAIIRLPLYAFRTCPGQTLHCFDMIVRVGRTQCGVNGGGGYFRLKGGNCVIRGFIICDYRQYFSGDKTKVDVLGGACCTHTHTRWGWRGNIRSYGRLVRKSEWKRHLGRLKRKG